ncbi:MAG TPA: NosD domain-containing protein, partial [Bacteroidia bacterium]|nr:NosD domain-containing protein [Bacteroidia bacterium]
QGVTMGTNNLFSGQLQNVLNSTTFESNAPLIAPHAGKKPEVFLDLNGIQNIDFVNENHFTKGSYGIKAVDCRFNLSDATFTEVDFGIESKVMSPTVTTGHEFHNNRFYKYFTAIRIDNGLNDKIGTNLFNPATHNGTQEQNYIGISLQACNGFLLTDNIFYKNKYGIMVHKSGLLNNRISTNTGTGNQFISCWRGIHTTGTNPSLQIKCNYFQNNQASTQYSAAWYVHDLLCNQGSNNQSDPQSPAGNRFYHAPASRVDLVSKQGSGPNGLNFIYYHHSPNGHPEVKPTVNNANWIQLVNKNIAYDQLTACTGITLMVLADNSPDTAKLIIDNTTDSILARQYANELVQWYIIHNMDSAAIDYLNTNNLGLDERLLFSLYAEHGAYTETTDLLAQ